MIISVTDNKFMKHDVVYMDGDDYELGFAVAEIINTYRERLLEGGNTEEEADKVIVELGKLAYSPAIQESSKYFGLKNVKDIFDEAERWRYEDRTY